MGLPAIEPALLQGVSCVIWDWNGTLLDDVPVCIDVINHLLRLRNLPEVPSQAYYRSVFTFPVIKYYEALGFEWEKEDFTQVAQAYVSAYQRSVFQCDLQPGARELLSGLQRAGLRQAVVSAARQDHLVMQVAPFDLFSYFTELIGTKDNLAESKTKLAQAFLSKAGIPPQSVLFIGDTVHDYETAAACGSRCVLVAQGHQDARRLRETGVPVAKSLKGLREVFFGKGG